MCDFTSIFRSIEGLENVKKMYFSGKICAVHMNNFNEISRALDQLVSRCKLVWFEHTWKYV